jgi:hypothetical protein
VVLNARIIITFEYKIVFYFHLATLLIPSNIRSHIPMNNLRRNSLLAQRLPGIGNALKSAGQGPVDNAAALSSSLISLMQRIQLSTDAGGDDASTIEHEPPPKKRRGRPPKAKPIESETAREEATITSDNARSSAAKDATTSSSARSAESPKTPSTWPSSKETPTSAGHPPRPPKSQPFPQGLSTIINPLFPRDPSNWHSGASIADLAISTTDSASTSPSPPFGFYVDVPSSALPEAEASFYHDPLLTDEKVKQTHYGCKAATAEFESSGKRVVLHRPVIADVLRKALSNAAGEAQRHHKIYIAGWTGAGKSMALYTLAATARAAGKVVMYIPAASLLTQGGRFYRRENAAENGEEETVDHIHSSSTPTVWDTPEAARHILTAVMNAHADQLATMPISTNSSATTFFENKKFKSLAEVATAGLASADPSEIVEAAISVKDGILSNSNGMVVVDEYNALYSHTGYHEPMHQFYRRPLAVDELRLAKSFRILEEDGESGSGSSSYKGVAVVAPSYGGSISPALRVLPNHSISNSPKDSGDSAPKKKKKTTTDVIRVPRFDLNEVGSFAAMSVGTGGLVSMPSDVELRRALALTNGNGKELREMSTTLLLAEGPLGVSLGYKAFAVAKKQYNVALEM